MRPHDHPDAADLLRTEHAVVRVLASAAGEAAAYPGLLAAIGESLSCAGALWLPGDDGELRCAETWPAGAAAGAELVGTAWSSGVPVAAGGAFAFPLRGIGVMAFATAAPLEADAALLATMESLGTQISQFVERCRAQQAVRSSDARKSAILNAAFDCIVTMDHNGAVVEVNRAAEQTFGYAAADMVGHDLAELIIPPHLRDAHRRGLARYLRTGLSAVGGHPFELDGMRSDGSEFPVEIVITRADLPGPPLFCGYLRDVTEAREREADLRRLADEQTALRRVATAVAAETDPRTRVRRRDRGGRAAARRPELEHGALQRGRHGHRRRRLERGQDPQRARRRDGADGRRHSLGARVADRRPGAHRRLRRTGPESSPRPCAGSASAPRSPGRSSSTDGCGAP